ncbi:BnaC03g69250D [Brassica napus]|uniref:BnaC03g69250D protein n=1 Tax=Brassica napus TaxID=3708 RepID=A0A078IBQ0_BRANA|nr:BnaC03g69250D [Brassica napus]
MDDAKKQEWSRTILCLPNYPVKLLGADVDTFSGATPAGEIYATISLISHCGVRDKTKKRSYWFPSCKETERFGYTRTDGQVSVAISTNKMYIYKVIGMS